MLATACLVIATRSPRWDPSQNKQRHEAPEGNVSIERLCAPLARVNRNACFFHFLKPTIVLTIGKDVVDNDWCVAFLRRDHAMLTIR